MQDSIRLGDATILRNGGRLVLENSLVGREISLERHVLATLSLRNIRTGREWVLRSRDDDECAYPAVTFAGRDGFVGRFQTSPEVRLKQVTAPLWEQPHLLAELVFQCDGLEMRRFYQIYPNCPATVSWSVLSGEIDAVERPAPECDRRGRWSRFGSPAAARPNAEIHERLLVNEKHLRIRNISLTDCTDFNDNYVQEQERRGYMSPLPLLLEGNLLLASSLIDEEGFFLIKESPVLADQPDHPDGDFALSYQQDLIAQVGWGITPDDLRELGAVTSWRCVIGVFDSSPDADAHAVKRYLRSRCLEKPGRDWCVMCNQWGDRREGHQLSEEFVLREIDVCARIGVEAYMLDAGWQKGGMDQIRHDYARNVSPFYCTDDYWEVDPGKFPHGLKGVADEAAGRGVQLLFWFNPDASDENANWEKDAREMLRLWQEYGARMVKVDGVWNVSRLADLRNRRMLEHVIEESGGETTHLLDITQGVRWGYLYGHHLGVLFVENRYTHWRNYFPYRVHANLWDLSRYLMPQRMQFEILNNQSERMESYLEILRPDDPFTPEKYPIDYLFASVMFANPLLFLEPTALTDDQIETLAGIIRVYLGIRNDLFSGDIYPIGERPSGRSITGFQSNDERSRSGFVCVFREATARHTSLITLRRLPAQARPLFDLLHGSGEACAEDGAVRFTLPEERSYALFRFRV